MDLFTTTLAALSGIFVITVGLFRDTNGGTNPEVSSHETHKTHRAQQGFKCSRCAKVFQAKPAFERHLDDTGHRASLPKTKPVSRSRTTMQRRVEKNLTPVVVSEHTQRQGIYCTIMVDRSDSMAGERITAALEGVADLKRCLRGKDLVTLQVSNDTVRPVFKALQPAKVGMERPQSNMETTGCSTALLDAVVAAATDAEKNCGRRLPMVIVLTDGGDNSSRRSSVSQAKQAFGKVAWLMGFRGPLLSVGQEGYGTLQALSAGGKRCRTLKAEESAQGVKAAFQFATKQVEQMAETVTVTETRIMVTPKVVRDR